MDLNSGNDGTRVLNLDGQYIKLVFRDEFTYSAETTLSKIIRHRLNRKEYFYKKFLYIFVVKLFTPI